MGSHHSAWPVNRKLASTLAAALLLCTSASAQQWAGAVKIGAVSSTFIGNLDIGPTSWDRKTGFAASVAFGLDLGRGLLPQAELHYVQMGAETAALYQDVPVILNSDLTYLSLPLFLQYRLRTRATAYPRLFAGPFAAFKMESYLTITPREGGLAIIEQDQSVESLDYGVAFGLALDFEFAAQLFTVEARYTRGMRDVSRPDPLLGDPQLNNAGLVFMVGLHY